MGNKVLLLLLQGTTTYRESQTADKAPVVSNVSSFVIWLSSGIHHATGGAGHMTKVFLTQILTTNETEQIHVTLNEVCLNKENHSCCGAWISDLN